jgi:outer membrane protein TolC
MLHATALIMFIAGMPCKALGASPISAPPPLAELIEEALKNNRSIHSIAARMEALKQRIPAAAALPDPKIGFAVQNLPMDSFAFDREPMTQKQVFVEQTVPWVSKLELRSKTAAGKAAQEKAGLEAARLELCRQVAVAWYESGYVAESRRINQGLIELIGQIRRDAESRYAVGRGQQQDIFQAEVELSRRQDEAVRLESLENSIQDRLHELTNREGYQSIAPPSQLPEPKFRFSVPALTEAALTGNPTLKGLEAAIALSEAETGLAAKEYYPDFNIRFSYGQRDQDRTGRDLPDFFSIALALDIPLWYHTKQAQELAAAENDQRYAQNRYQDFKARLPYKIHALIAEIEDTCRRYRLYTQELIPQAGQWADSAMDAYQVGREEFDAMIDARMRVLKYRQEASRLFYAAYQKRAELEALIGGVAQECKTGSGQIFRGGTDARE